jgi:DNA-binding NarL/FixJ family response regulator
MAIKVLLADDHTVLRQGIAQAIESQEDMSVVAQAANGEEALALARTHNPDVLLLDINMPGIDGVEVTRVITSEMPEVNVLILTMYRRNDYVIQAIKAGASGYLLKEVEMAEMLSAIRSVAQGDAVLDPSVASRVLANLRGEGQPEKSPVESELAERDVDILRLLAQGLGNQDIADQLHLSEKTVRNRLSQVFKKFGLKNRTEAALFAVRIGLVEQNQEED